MLRSHISHGFSNTSPRLYFLLFSISFSLEGLYPLILLYYGSELLLIPHHLHLHSLHFLFKSLYLLFSLLDEPNEFSLSANCLSLLHHQFFVLQLYFCSFFPDILNVLICSLFDLPQFGGKTLVLWRLFLVGLFEGLKLSCKLPVLLFDCLEFFMLVSQFLRLGVDGVCLSIDGFFCIFQSLGKFLVLSPQIFKTMLSFLYLFGQLQ